MLYFLKISHSGESMKHVKVLGIGNKAIRFVKKLAKNPIDDVEYHGIDEYLYNYYLNEIKSDNRLLIQKAMLNTLFERFNQDDIIVIFIENSEFILPLAQSLLDILTILSENIIILSIPENTFLQHFQNHNKVNFTKNFYKYYLEINHFSFDIANNLIVFISNTISHSNIIKIDLADLRTLIDGANKIEFVNVLEEGNCDSNRAEIAVKRLIKNIHITPKNTLYTISSGYDVTLEEIYTITEHLCQFFPDDALIVFSINFQLDMNAIELSMLVAE